MKFISLFWSAALAAALLLCATLLTVPDRPAEASETRLRNGDPAFAVAARTTTRRASRRSRSRAALRRSAASPQAKTAVPIPRPKPGSEAAAAPSPPQASDETPRQPEPAAVAAPNPQLAGRPTPTMPALPKDPAAARAELRALYAVNALSYRCSFELTTREGAVLDRAVTALETALKLDTQQADTLFSDVDLGLYGNGGDKICQKGGAGAKSFRATLDRLLGE